MKILFVPAVIIFGWVIHHNIKRNKGNDKEQITSYLEKDAAANFTRRGDISKLPYIQIPYDKLPLDITLKDENLQSKIEEYQRNIRELSDKKLLNLSGMDNISLKANYGIANLELLTAYEGNYNQYIRLLSLYANCIYKEYPSEAADICRYCIDIGSDISTTYTLLGAYYLSHHDEEHFKKLYDRIPDRETIAGKNIIRKLDDLKKTTNADHF